MQLDFMFQDVLDDGAAPDSLEGDDLGLGNVNYCFSSFNGFRGNHVPATGRLDLNCQFGEAGVALHEPVVEVSDLLLL